MKVDVRHGAKGVCYSNIIWDGRYPMRHGKFPENHPCSDSGDAAFTGASESKPSAGNIGKFRERGYWASCFPEGDGITFEPLKEQSREQVLTDIHECFGWELS